MLRRASGTDIAGMSWAVNVSGEPVPLIAYSYRQPQQGVSIEVVGVSRGKRTLLKGAFVATMSLDRSVRQLGVLGDAAGEQRLWRVTP